MPTARIESGAGQWDADLRLLLHAASEAGAAAMAFFGRSPETWWKNEGRSPVTEADYAANDVLLHILRQARPDYGWLSEESEDDGDRHNFDTLFVVDPIDGTRAFMNGLKTWCVSIAVVQDGRPVAGVLFAPALGEVFAATEDGPATKDGMTIELAASAPAGPLAVAAAHDTFSRLPRKFLEKARRVEHIPSLAYRLAMIADGRIDATLVKPHAHDWDLAAADLILRRAGGRLVTLDGEPVSYNSEEISHGVLCAAHETAIKAVLKAVAEAQDH